MIKSGGCGNSGLLNSSLSSTRVPANKYSTATNMFDINRLVCVFVFLSTSTFADYWKERQAFVKLEQSQMLGSSIILTQKEELANKLLMGYKFREVDAGFEEPGRFAPRRHFFNARKDIEKSKVFKFIQKIPKGAALHGHDTAIVSQEYLYNLTYTDNLYACTVNGRLRLNFLLDKSCNWTLISVLRKQDPHYDNWVRSQLTLDVKNPRERYADVNIAWQAFMDIFETVDPLITYKPVFQKHFYQALKELHEDNVMYLEFRGTLPPVYELDGTQHGPMDLARFYQEIIAQFKSDYPDFLGARFIYGPVRKVNNATANNYVGVVKDLKKRFPDLLAGFDLVGQEDPGDPLTSFIKQLEEIAADGVNFFFHSGETKWYGETTDSNLIDAVLLGTKRIGHGYALTKHPLVMNVVKERQIAIEVCPISNQVLTMVDDMRNHPAAALMAEGYPVVVSYDDPSFWSTKGLSYDFYMAFMGIASRNADLKLIKQLAKNSLIYSAMPSEEKKMAIRAWEKQWEEFIDKMVVENYGVSFHNNDLDISVVSVR